MDLEKPYKVNKRGVGGYNKPWEKNVNTPYFVYKEAYVHDIFFLLVASKMEVEEGKKTTKFMRYFDNSKKA